MTSQEILRSMTTEQKRQARIEEDQTGKHKHQCDHCWTVWEHPNPTDEVPREHGTYIEAHTCPRCGIEQYWKYLGTNPVEFNGGYVYDPDEHYEAIPVGEDWLA